MRGRARQKRSHKASAREAPSARWVWSRSCLAGSRGRRGQMTVELAVVLPVTLAVALVGYNLARFAALCATFDRVAPDAVIAHGVAPAGQQTSDTATGEVRAAIDQALASDACEVEVSASGPSVAPGGGGISFPVSPLLTTYTCTLRYHPWPRVLTLAGVAVSTPLELTHQRTLTVDRYRPGVVV